MAALPALRRLLAPPRRRLLAAEQRFFDAYGRGGTHAGRPLVIPLGFFARADVSRALERWFLRRERLNAERLEGAWRAEGGRGRAEDFRANLDHYVALATRAR